MRRLLLGSDIIEQALATFVHPQTQARILIGILEDLPWTPVSLHPHVEESDQLTQLCVEEARSLEESGQSVFLEQFLTNARQLGLTLPPLAPAPFLAQEQEQEETVTSIPLDTYVTEGNLALNDHQSLEQVIRLRDEGQLEEALRIIDAALAGGAANPWWLDNKARVLLALGNREEALQIWEQLAGMDDPHLADVAFDMLSAHGRTPDAQDQEQIVSDDRQELEEVIRLRNEGQLEEALSIIEAALSAGATNPWWLDNKARVLVDHDQCFEALEIWERLISQSTDDALVTTAREMVARLHSGFEAPLLKLCADAHWTPQHLPADQDSSLLNAVLQEIIATRESGHAELSLSLAETAQGQGLASPWLEDNRAWAMLMLDRPGSAAEVWESLAQQETGDVAAAASQMAVRARQQLIDSLRELCARHGWLSRHLPDGGEEPVDLTYLCLQEVIAAREGAQVSLSLALAEKAQQAGLRSGWLIDNKARALVLLGCEAEALALWLELKDDANPNIADMASKMVDLFGIKVQRRNICDQADQLILRGEAKEASHLLVAALLEDPECEDYRQYLGRSVGQEFNERNDRELASEIRDHELSLEIHNRLLEEAERRLGLSLP